MPNRFTIVGSKLERYSVSEDIPDTLSRLSFKPNSKVANWEIFTRRDKDFGWINEFAALYGNKEFFVSGAYSNLDTQKKDLEIMTSYVFEGSRFSKIIRKKAAPIMMGILGGEVSGLGLDMLVNGENLKSVQFIQNYFKITENEAMIALMGLVWGIPLATSITGIISEAIINTKDGLKLSKESKYYLYGKDAEIILQKELVYEKIKSGEIPKTQFLR